MAMSSNPILPYHLAVGLNDSTVKLFDRRMITSNSPHPFSVFCPPNLKEKPTRVTSVQYSPDGQEILVSYSADYIYLFSPLDQHSPLVFTSRGHPPHVPSKEEQEKIVDGYNGESQSSLRRLRLRGDWSDTGPDARPLSEEQQSLDERQSILERVSSAFTRWVGERLLHDEDSHSDSDDEETQLLSRSLSSASSPNREGVSDGVGEVNGDAGNAMGESSEVRVSENSAGLSDGVDDHVTGMGKELQELDTTVTSSRSPDAADTVQIQQSVIQRTVACDSAAVLPSMPQKNRDNEESSHAQARDTVLPPLSVNAFNGIDDMETNDSVLPTAINTHANDGDRSTMPASVSNSGPDGQDGDCVHASVRPSDAQQARSTSREEVAACRIQKAFRLHLWNNDDSLSNEEREDVIRPRVNMMYKGHRNARTMVSLYCSICKLIYTGVRPVWKL